MSDLFRDRNLLDGLSVVAPMTIKEGLISPDVGVISGVRQTRGRPGTISAPAVMMSMPQLATWTKSDAPDRPATGFGFSASTLIGSGTGEVVERYSAAIVPDDLPHISHDRRVDIGRWLPFSDRQYARSGFPFIDPRTTEIKYVWAFDPVEGSSVGVPADLVYLRATGEQWCTISSNGLAAHRSAGAAARAAVFELIERDSFLRSWYGGLSHPVLEAGTLLAEADGRWGLSPSLLDLIRRVVRSAVSLTLVKMPAAGGLFGVLACARSSRIGLAVGCAAKPTMAEAVHSAIVEAVQTYNWALTMSPGTAASGIDSLESHIAFHANPANAPASRFIDSGSRTNLATFLSGVPVSLEGAINRCHEAGWSIYLADVTSSDARKAGWHVIRALSPQAATLDVTEIHERQHRNLVTTAPHPFP